MKPRIVLLSAFLTPLRSGAEACVEEIAHRLHSEFDITIITARMQRALPEDDPFRGQARVIRLGIGHNIDKWLFPFLAPWVTWKIQPQIIHAVLESFAGLALIFSRPLVPRAKTILTCQSTNTSFLVRFMHRHVDRVVVISRALVQRAQKFGRTDALLIPNGIDVRAIGRACSEASKVPGRILFVGRLEPMKGVDTLLRAFARLREETAAGAELPFRAHMRIVGCGSNERALKRLSADLGIADDVTFVGFVPIPRVYQEFAEAQIFCGLSRSEALGNVFLEAQAAGCAVIATRTGGIPDIVEDGRTGLLVPPDDAAVAARALRELLSDPRRWAELARAGLAHVQTYDWSGIVARYAELYRTLLM